MNEDKFSGEYTSPEATVSKQKINTWIIVAIVGFVLLCCCVVLVFGIPTVVALFGPAVGEVFSNVIEEIGTPVP